MLVSILTRMTEVQSGAADGLIAVLSGALMLPALIVALFMIICFWKLFSKADEPGWASIIPIYNLYVLCKIAGKGVGILLLLLILFPIGFIIVMIGLAKSFGKETGYAVGLILLPIIFLPMLAFGSSKYIGDRG